MPNITIHLLCSSQKYENKYKNDIEYKDMKLNDVYENLFIKINFSIRIDLFILLEMKTISYIYL